MRYTIDNGVLAVTADSLGAELCAITGKDGTEYLCPDAVRNWDGRSPVLFPNTGAVRDGYTLVDGKPFPFGQHGFARKSEFTLSAHSDTAMTFELRWSEKTLKLYPFRFVLRITYKLESNRLRVLAQVHNEGDKALHASLGFHPGFACPFVPGETAEDYDIVFPERMTASRLVLRDALVSETTHLFWNNLSVLPVQEGMFDGGSFSMTDLSSKAVCLRSRKSGRSITLSFENYPNLVLWAPREKPITNICIEPWYGMPDAADTDHSLKTKPFTFTVEPCGCQELVFTMTLD